MGSFPEIVCLCGALKFMKVFREKEYEFEMNGIITLGPSFKPDVMEQSGTAGCTPDEKIMLDRLHKHKIDISNRVYVINVGGYIGESTRSEIEHARKRGIPVEFMVDTKTERI